MEKGQGNGTDTLKKDNDFVRRGDVKRLLENTVCLHEELPAQIDIIPAADVVARGYYDRLLAENDALRKERPVVHGKWNRMKDGSLECSVCESIAPYKDNYYGDVIEAPELPFCPWCGADMREVEHD